MTKSLMNRAANALPWLGAPLLLTGLFLHPVLQRWHGGRFVELLLIGALMLGLSWLIRRLRPWSTTSLLALLWIAALSAFCGPLPVLATALLMLASAALGGMAFPRQPLALQALAGALLLACGLGWVVTLPIHHWTLYLLLCAALVGLRRATLRAVLTESAQHWQDAVAGAPRMAAFAVLLLGLASTACWLPTLQYDDLAYHLRLPWQLQEQGFYNADPRNQIWALAPWTSDLLHALPQVMSGSESRGPVAALWLLALGSGSWHLAGRLGAAVRERWLAVALVASLPLTASLATSMQTEPLTAATLIWMTTVVAGPRNGSLRFWLLLAVLTGGMAGAKLIALPMSAAPLLWALLRHPWPSLPRISLVLATGIVVGGASYVLAGWQTGNPVLPLFNGIFRSPFFAPENFLDLRYRVGFGLDLPWRLTFDAPRYFEAHEGAAGFALIGLAGLWLLALLQPRTRAAAAVATAALLIPLLPLQYLRYAYPGLALLCVVLAATVDGRNRAVMAMVVAVCVLNVAFLPNGNWMLRSGALKETLISGGDDTRLQARYAPERVLATAIRASHEDDGNVLLLDAGDAFFAEFGSRGRTTSWYAPALSAAAKHADQDPSGRAWAQLLLHEQVRHVILRSDKVSDAARQGMALRGAIQRQTVEGRQWWSMPVAPASAPAISEGN